MKTSLMKTSNTFPRKKSKQPRRPRRLPKHPINPITDKPSTPHGQKTLLNTIRHTNLQRRILSRLGFPVKEKVPIRTETDTDGYSSRDEMTRGALISRDGGAGDVSAWRGWCIGGGRHDRGG